MSGTTDQPRTWLSRFSDGDGGPVDSIFRVVTTVAALLIATAVFVILGTLFIQALPAIERFGVSFLFSSAWNPAKEQFGALPFISGTLLTSAMALLLAIPVSIGIAVLLTQYVTGRLKELLIFVVELLAAVPSVIYGLWGLFVLAPILQTTVNPAIAASPLGLLPIFGEASLSYNLFTASLVLAIMVIPIITSFSRESIARVPTDQRDAGIALGLTRWEVIRGIVIPYARAGIVSAVILGLGRAIGETMAVTMLVGNTPQAVVDFFQPGSTMSALLANEFNQSASAIHTASLFEIGFILFFLSFVVNSIARVVISRISHEGSGGA